MNQIRLFKRDVHNAVFKVNLPLTIIASVLKGLGIVQVGWMVILWSLLASVALLLSMYWIKKPTKVVSVSGYQGKTSLDDWVKEGQKMKWPII